MTELNAQTSQAAAQTASPAQGWVAGDGTFANHQMMPEDVRNVVLSKKWSNVADIVKSYRELESFIGGHKSRLNIPDKLDDSALNEIYSKLGRPDTPDKYQLQAKVPEGMQIDNQLVERFKKFAHAKNLTTTQFNDLVQFQLDVAAEAAKADEQARLKQIEEAAIALKQEWKDAYASNFSTAKHAAEKLGIMDELEKLGLADNPAVIRMLYKLGTKLSEDTLGVRTNAPAMSREEELKKLLASPEFNDKMHPGNQAAFRRFLELHGLTGQA